MTKHQINEINNLKANGKSLSEIAKLTNISINTLKSHFKRHPSSKLLCLNCLKEIEPLKGNKIKKFCSTKCRLEYWNHNKDKVNKKAYYTLVCKYCNKEFISYGNNKRKYCSRSCYYKSKSL